LSLKDVIAPISFALQQRILRLFGEKISLANFSFATNLDGEGGVRPVSQPRRAKMAWKTPKIVEVPVGMEINMYACAARK
jgi:coenzyme PQQ precursor peptide PqqA